MTDIAGAASGVDAGYSGLIGQMQKNDKEADTANKGYIKQIEDIKPPSAPELKPSPEPKQSDPLNGFGTAATWLATFGSLLTRKPLTNALNANADVMDAVKQQDATDFKRKWDTWKTENENAWKMADWNQQLYKDALEKPEAEQKITASSTKNKTLEMAIQAKMAESYHKDYVTQLKKGQKDSEHFNNLVEKKADDLIKRGEDPDQAYVLATAEVTNMAKGKEQGGGQIDWEKMKPTDIVAGTGMNFAAVKANAKAIAAGAKPSQLGLGYSMSPAKKAVENYMAVNYPDVDLAAVELGYAGQQHGINALQTRSAMVTASAEELDELIPAAKDAIKDYKPGEYKDLNDLANAANTHLNDPQLGAMNTAIQGVATAYTSMLVRNGVPTDAARSKADTLINNSFSTGKFDAVFKQMGIEKTAILKGLETAKKDIMKSGDAEGKAESGNRVKVNDPQGKPHTIDASELDEALANGWSKR